MTNQKGLITEGPENYEWPPKCLSSTHEDERTHEVGKSPINLYIRVEQPRYQPNPIQYPRIN